MLILKAQQSPWTLGRSMENIWSWQLEKMYYPLCMKTFGNGRKALQRNVKLSQLYNCTFEKMTNKVSTRCQICNHLPMKNMQVILSVFCLSSENNLRICVCICNLFLEGGTRSKKKWYFGKMEGGGNKMGVLIIGQSLRPTDTLRECNIIKLIDY